MSDANVPMLQRTVTEPSALLTTVDAGLTPWVRHPTGRPLVPGPARRGLAPSGDVIRNSAMTLATDAPVGNPVSDTE